MAKKKVEKTDLAEKYGPMLKKLGDDLDKGAQKGKEGMVKMMKLARIQLDIMGLALREQTLYYEIGKEVAEKLKKGDLDVPGMEKYKKRLDKIEARSEKDKKTLSRVGQSRKKKTSAKK